MIGTCEQEARSDNATRRDSSPANRCLFISDPQLAGFQNTAGNLLMSPTKNYIIFCKSTRTRVAHEKVVCLARMEVAKPKEGGAALGMGDTRHCTDKLNN